MAAHIKYNGEVIASPEAGQTATLKCKGDNVKMLSDIVVEVDEGGGSGGLAINGIIEQYKVNAGATVNAGDFVEFVNKWGSNNIFDDTSMVSYASACKLGANSVFVAYRYYDGSIYHLMGIVNSIDDAKITKGTPITICSNADGFLVEPTALTDSKVFVAYRYYDGSTYHLKGTICDIDGTSVSCGAEITLASSDDVSGYKPGSSAALTDSKVFVAYEYQNGSTYYLKGTICIIEGDEITKGAEAFITTISGNNYSSIMSISAVALTDRKVCLLYHRETSSVGYFTTVVCAINDAAIVIGTTKSFSAAYENKYGCPSLVALTDSKVLITYQKYERSYGYYLRAYIYTIEGTTLTSGSELTLKKAPNSYDDEYYRRVSLVALTDSKVFMTYQFRSRSAPAYSLYGKVVTINGTSVSSGSEVVLGSSSNIFTSQPVVAFSDDSVFVLGCGDISRYIGATIEGTTITVNTESEEIGTYIQPATSRLHNVGIAATSGNESDTVDVYVVG